MKKQKFKVVVGERTVTINGKKYRTIGTGKDAFIDVPVSELRDGFVAECPKNMQVMLDDRKGQPLSALAGVLPTFLKVLDDGRVRLTYEVNMWIESWKGFLAFDWHTAALVILVQDAAKENADVQETYNIVDEGLLNYGFTVTVGGETFADALDSAKEIVDNILTPLRKLDEQIEAHLVDILRRSSSHTKDNDDGY